VRNDEAGVMLGDEVFAGSRNFCQPEEAAREAYGYKYVVPAQQGRGAVHGAAKIPCVCVATAVNMVGGQPISRPHLRQLRERCERLGIRVIHDATRVAGAGAVGGRHAGG
jgi:tryptophanase